MNKNQKNKAGTTKMLNAVRGMPPLFHKHPGKEFDFEKSDVVQWLLRQDGVRNFIFSKMSAYGLIKYNSNTGKWYGVDYMGCDINE